VSELDPATARALSELGNATGEPLRIGGVLARDLLARFGSPLYVFDAAVLRARVAAVRAAFGPRVQLLWSVKANPSLAVTRVLREAGAGAEIASLGELEVALAAGHAASALRFAGPGKTEHELDTALGAGLGCFHVEGADEVEALARLAARRGRIANVAVRVNFAREAAGARLRMSGRSSRFGIDEDQVPAVLRAIAAQPALRLAGLHAYAGTQSFDAESFVQHCALLAAAAARWERELGSALRELDLGGGFGVAAFAGDGAFDLAAAAAGVRTLLAQHDREGRTWFVELGRFLAAPAGVYLARVVRTKTSGGEAHAVLDGGLHHCASAAGLGTVLKRAPLLVRADEPGSTGAAVTIGGPLCTPADQFAEQVPIGPLRAGDVVAVLNAGAYGLSYSPHSFLSHPAPAEVLVDGGDTRCVRDRGEARDALRGQHDA
jgi:diaminopimelate decarboxylase